MTWVAFHGVWGNCLGRQISRILQILVICGVLKWTLEEKERMECGLSEIVTVNDISFCVRRNARRLKKMQPQIQSEDPSENSKVNFLIPPAPRNSLRCMHRSQK